MEKERKMKVRGGKTAADKKEIADQHERKFLSASSIDAIPDSADEKSGKESGTEYSEANNSNKHVFKSNMIGNKNDEMPPQYRHIRYGPRSVKHEYYIKCTN